MRVSIIDAMAEVQSLDKPDWIKSCFNLADHFSCRIFEKYGDSDEIRLIFDRYDLPSSPKEATRRKRQGNQHPVYYRMTPSRHIAKFTMKKLLSHAYTKNELAEYFAQKTVEHAEQNGTWIVVAYGCECKGSKKDMSCLKSDQEEADTKNNTVFVTGEGENHREIKLQPIVRALGPTKTAALPASHALTGADNTGAFSNKGKLTCWSVFNEASEDVFHALSQLGTNDLPSSESQKAVEKLVCQFFLPKTNISTVKALRWWLFTKKQAKSERLPPTSAALHQAILRTHYRLLVWNNDRNPNSALPSPKDFGWEWKEEDKAWIPVITTLPPAPKTIIHLVRCRCVKERCTTKRCQCRKAEMSCTDLCGFSDTGEDCENMPGGVTTMTKMREMVMHEDGDDDEAEYEYISDSDEDLDSDFE
ncbi:hypothetical protein ACROYT_G016161 [Oculina patagonica]